MIWNKNVLILTYYYLYLFIVSSVYSILSYSTFCCEGPSGLQQLRRSCETPLGVWTVSFQPAKVAPPSEVMSSDIAPSAKIVRPLVRWSIYTHYKDWSLQSTYGSQENDTAFVPDNVCSLIIINVHRRLSKSRQFNSSSLDFLFIYICVMANWETLKLIALCWK